MSEVPKWLRATVIGLVGGASSIVLTNDTVVLIVVLACALAFWYRVERSFEKDLTSGNGEK
jgi:hypothetical protein